MLDPAIDTRNDDHLVKFHLRLLKCGPFVKQETEDILMAWKRIYGITPGRAIDQVIAYVSKDPRFLLKTQKE